MSPYRKVPPWDPDLSFRVKRGEGGDKGHFLHYSFPKLSEKIQASQNDKK